MIGKLTIDKASMNMSYFLYSLEIIKNNGGIVSRAQFGKDMASFIKAPAMIDGKENRTPFNKSKLPRYFGFIDLIEENDDQLLTLTNRGQELVSYIEYSENSTDPASMLHIKEEFKQRFVELMMESVLFDSFGKNNCGAEQSCTDIEPPKIVFKSIQKLGRANAEEICFIMYGLNRAYFSSFEEAVKKVHDNRKIGIHTYDKTMKDWGIENIAHDCKIINIFTDSNINLISSEKEKDTKITYYELTRNAKNYEKEIINMSPFYEPLQLVVYCESKNENTNNWIQNNVLGKIGNKKFIFEISCSNTEEAENFAKPGGLLEDAIIKAYAFPKNNIYVIIKGIDKVSREKLFGSYKELIKREYNFKSIHNGCSEKKIENKQLYDKIIKVNRKAVEILDESGVVLLPSNLNIVGIIEMEKKMENQTFDYEFKTCLLKTEEMNNGTIEEKIRKKYESMDFSEMEGEIDDLYEEFREKYSPNSLLKVSDKDLPRYMFLSETNNQANMCWNLEFNPKIKKYFGAVGGGNAYTYGLHYSQKHKSWMTGPGNKPISLDENGAIQIAKEIRQSLIDAVEIVNKYKGIKEVSKYAEMHAELEEQCGNYTNKLWFKKYLHMMFPKMFATFYNYEWLTFLNRKCEFPQHDDLYEISGELSFLAERVGLPNCIVSKILFELFGYPNQEKKEEFEDGEENREMVDRKPRSNKQNPLNVIIYGAPGTGKTYSTAGYAVDIVEGRKVSKKQMNETERTELMNKYRELVRNGQIVFTTFHQSYGYEDFIQGLRPVTENGEMNFIPADGVFKKIADRAMQDQEKNYVIIIDEINRGNISKVFGELITLIEEDKRWGENNQLSVILPSGQEFAVPNNLYIVGTMNSADKSIALIDTALRRRFEFIEVAPNEDLIKDATLKNVLVQLNAVLRKQLESSDLLVGHAYFIGKTKDDLANILNRNIIPLLYEYFYDNEKKVKDALAKAIEGTDVKINETINGRIRVE